MYLLSILKDVDSKAYRVTNTEALNVAKRFFESRKGYSNNARANGIAIAIKASGLFDFVSRPVFVYNDDENAVFAILVIDYKNDLDIVITCGDCFGRYFAQISTYKGGTIK